MRAFRSPWGWALAAILLAALYVRLASIQFGLPALNDPDELMFELGAVKMLRGPTLNPGWFGHPATTTMYVLALIDIAVFLTGWALGLFPSIKAFGAAIYADPSWIILPGRLAMTAFALATILLTYRLATKLNGRRTGLISAAILAVSPVHITYSQIIRSDMMACFFMLLTTLSALNIAADDRRRDYVLASLWLGCAIVTKWPFALTALPVAGAVWLRLDEKLLSPRQALARLLSFGALTLAFGVLLSPYLVLDYSTVMRNLAGEGQARHLGATGGTIGDNAFWYLKGPLLTGLSATGMVLLIPGSLLVWRNRRARVMILPLLACFFLILCAQTMVWERWALPLLPLCAITAGIALDALARWTGPRWQHGAVAAGIIAMVAPMLSDTLAQSRERMNDTRQEAAAWARRNIPPGSTVLIEHFAFDLVSQPWRFLFPVGDAGCLDAIGLLQGKTSYGPIDGARGTRANVDYGTMSPGKRATCRPDFAILTQYDRYRLEQKAFPVEYAAYRALLEQGKVVARFAPRPGVAGGRVVTIVAFPQAHSPKADR